MSFIVPLRDLMNAKHELWVDGNRCTEFTLAWAGGTLLSLEEGWKCFPDQNVEVADNGIAAVRDDRDTLFTFEFRVIVYRPITCKDVQDAIGVD